MQTSNANLHVTGNTIYLFDSICTQDILQINKLRAAITCAISDARKSTTKTLTIYVDCPDTIIDERFQPTLSEIHSAVQSGIQLDIKNAGAPDSTYTRVLESIVEVAKIPTPTNSPFRKNMKQH